MSRFIKQSMSSENAYVEFRFENSLRKYQQKPIKKVKCNERCSHCIEHHKKKNISVSPFSQRHPTLTAKMSKQSIERRSAGDKVSEGHLVSSNKTIKLSKRKVLDELSDSRNNNLQMKIYASLVNISQGDSKMPKSQSGKSQLQEEVYLNDFEVSEGMQEEKESEDDEDFGRIELSDKSEMKKSGEESNEELMKGQECQGLLQVSQAKDVQNPVLQQKQICQEQEQDSSLQIELPFFSDKEPIKKQHLQPEPQIQQEHQEALPQFPPQQHEYHKEHEQHQEQKQHEEPEQCPHSQEYPDDSCLHNQQESLPILQDSSSLKRQSDDRLFSTRIVDKSSFDSGATHKCLFFQGGRIYIDAEGQHFYISVRVFNKLQKKCSSISDLIATLVQQRPYLQAKKYQIQYQLQNYLSQ